MTSASSRTPDVQYLDFVAARQAVAEARDEAAALGAPELAPPVELDECNRQVVLSALMAPRTSWGVFEKYPTLPQKAAALAYAFAKSQACIDGNKRVAVILVGAFLYINGTRLETRPGELAAVILEAAESDPADRDEVTRRMADWISARAKEETNP
jgi:death on curing protein